MSLVCEEQRQEVVVDEEKHKDFLSEDSSSSSDEDDESDAENGGLTLDEKRALNVGRNDEFLQSLHLNKVLSRRKRTKRDAGKTSNNDDDDDDDNQKDNNSINVEERGVILPPLPGTSTPPVPSSVVSYAEHVGSILSDFPFRTRQVHQLASLLLSSSLSSGNGGSSGGSGIPIVVTGPPGTGKTSVVQAICHAAGSLDNHHAAAGDTNNNNNNNSNQMSHVLYTYIDLSTCRDYWLRQVHASVERQVNYGNDNNNNNNNLAFLKEERKKKNNARAAKRARRTSKDPAEEEEEATIHNNHGVGNGNERSPSSINSNNNNNKPRRRSRRSLTVSNTAASDQKATISNEGNHATAEDMAQESHFHTNHHQPLAIHALGRFLQHSLEGVGNNNNNNNRRPGRRLILVLDQAHLLLFPSSSSSQYERPNLLGQLLLLPRTVPGLKDKLSFVLITNHLFLTRTRLNRMVDPAKSLATLMGNLHPIQVHFPSYQGTRTFQRMFRTPRVSWMVTGQQPPTTTTTATTTDSIRNNNQNQSEELSTQQQAPLEALLYKSFIQTFISTMYDTCKDMNELIRMARLLWPIYIQPVSSMEKLEHTFKNHIIITAKTAATISGDSSNNNCDDDEQNSRMDALLLEYLDRRAIGQFRHALDTCCFTGAAFIPKQKQQHQTKQQQQLSNNPCSNLPHPARYLLLAAFLCQVNRPEKDRSLFSIQKNGRTTKRKNLNEEMANNNNNNATTRTSIRLRTFPLERMLSIYVSLMALHGMIGNGGGGGDGDSKDTMEQSSSTWQQRNRLASLQERVGEWLNLLVSIDAIQVHSSQEDGRRIRLSEPRYSCHVTADQAQLVASSLEFPLDRYVL